MNLSKLFTLSVFILLIHWQARAQVADFTADNTSGCNSLVVHFVNKSSSNADSIRWNLGNGVSVKDSAKVGTSYLTGTYTVTLKAYKNGLSNTKTMTITVHKAPVAAFSVNKVKVCMPDNVTFTDLSTKGDGNISSWSWDMRNGDVLTAQNPTYNYKQSDNYDVLLTVKDVNGCESSLLKSALVSVREKPVPSFSADPATACFVPVTVKFTNQSTGPGALTYNWNFGGTNNSTITNPSFNYTSFGNYHVKLTVTSDFGCSATLDVAAVTLGPVTASGTLSQNNKTIASNDYMCSGDIKFTDNSGNSSILWDFGDGNSTTESSGTYNINKQGQNTIKLIASPGTSCADTVTWKVNIENPVAGFIFNERACSSPVTVSFTNNSQNSTQYKWTFPDGPDITTTSPSHIFTLPADADPYVIHDAQSFDIKLLATSAHGCKDSITHSLTISKPTAMYQVTDVEGCAPQKITFTSSSISEDPISFYDWNFGDGKDTVTLTKVVSHTFTQTGTFPTQLVITNTSNCKATSSVLNVRTGKKPTPNFSFAPTAFCSAGLIQFTDLTSAGDNVDSWQYQVDGFTVPNSPMTGNPSYKVKSDTGTIVVKLIAGNNGCYAEKSLSGINTGPIGSYNYTTDCSNPLTYKFTGVIKAKGTPTYKWDFGDGVTNIVSLTPTHIFASAGDKTVKFITYNGICSDTASQIVRVRQSTIDFTLPVSGCAELPLVFTATPGNLIVDLCNDRYLWRFGDDSPAVLTNQEVISHPFATRGTFPVRLVATYENGCKDSITKSIQIFKPYAIISADQIVGCSPLLVTFQDVSKPDSNPLIKWDWDYGDGSTYSSVIAGNMPQNLFADNGSYFTSLTVTDANGCTDIASVNIGVATPDADFYADNTDLCSTVPVNFTYTFFEPDSVVWHFGDGKKLSSKDPNITSFAHSYANAGTYSVTLEVYKYKCLSTLTRDGYITVQKVDAHFSASDTVSTCFSKPITFTHLYPTAGLDGEWDFGDQGHTSVYAVARTYTYPEPGNYKVSLHVQSTYGCESTYSKNIVISGPTGRFTVSKDHICKGDQIKVEALNLVNVTSIEWLPGDGRFGLTANPLFISYADSGTKVITLALTGSGATCPTTIRDTISVAAVTANFIHPASTICAQIGIPFTNTSVGQASQLWDFGDNTPVISTLSPVHLFDAGQYTVVLSVIDAGICKDTMKFPITVLPTPSIKVDLDKSQCGQKQAILNATGTLANTTIVWSPAAGLTSTNTYQTIAYPANTTLYKATLTFNSSVCSKSDSIYIYRPKLTILPRDTVKTTIGNNVRIELKDSSSVKTFYWLPETNISNPLSFPADITAANGGTYLLIATEPNGCFVDTSKVIIVIDESNQTSHVPSAFRPGSDEYNNILYVRGRGIRKIIDFKIYNRWGNVVFSTTELTKGWDGTYQGKEQPIDTYIFTLTTEQYNGTITTEKGTILLLR